MKILKKILFSSIFFLCVFIQNTGHGETPSENTDISCEAYLPGVIASLQAPSETFTLLAATGKGLFTSDNMGADWRRRRVDESVRAVRDIALSGDDAALATPLGLYIGKTFSEEWKPVIGKRDLKGVVFVPKGIVVWDQKGLYLFDGHNWTAIGRAVIWRDIRDVVYDNNRLIVYVDNKISISKDMGEAWRDLTLFSRSDEVYAAGYEEDEENGECKNHDLLTILSSGQIAVLTKKGIYLIDDKKWTVDLLNTTGLPSSEVKAITSNNDRLFASTGSKIFSYDLDARNWETLTSLGGRGSVSTIIFFKDPSGRKWLFASRGKMFKRIRISDKTKRIRASWTTELKPYPTIREVQQMAIEYAEVSPEKIEGWRKAASWKAILPRLSIGYSEGRDDNVEIYKSASTSYVVQGPPECDNDWNVDLSWDLSDLIWNDAQTSIDSRSKLMVQLREDILEEVTRLYFEREKLLRELASRDQKKEGPDECNKELKIDELTAYIDALTGGNFSKALIHK